jgi:hypothetical protein
MSIRIAPAILAAVAFSLTSADAQPAKPQPPQSLRLYVLDCGIITPPNVDNFGLKVNEVADTRMITPCFLIVHPRGTMMWDTGEIPDSAFKDGASPQKLNNFTVDRPLLPQLAAIGYTPADITFFCALSLPWRSCRQRRPVRQVDLDRAEGRPGRNPRSTGDRKPRAGPKIFRRPCQRQSDCAERRGS